MQRLILNLLVTLLVLFCIVDFCQAQWGYGMGYGMGYGGGWGMSPWAWRRRMMYRSMMMSPWGMWGKKGVPTQKSAKPTTRRNLTILSVFLETTEENTLEASRYMNTIRYDDFRFFVCESILIFKAAPIPPLTFLKCVNSPHLLSQGRALPKMVCFGSFHLAYGKNVDPECACNLRNLWLDVVIAIDNSQSMGHDGLNEVAADIATVFAQSNITQALGQTTRVGIVTYGQTAVVKYNLTAFNDTRTFISTIFDLANEPTTDTEPDIYAGLATAQTVLHDGRVNGKRDNVQQAIILYASDYKNQGNDPVLLAQQIKEDGIGIITVAFNQFGEKNVSAELAKIATPGMTFSNMDTDSVGEIQRNGLCQLNCFCPHAWTQYTSQFGLVSARRFGLCLKLGDIDAMWTAAKIACQHLDNSAYLVSEFDRAKHSFTYPHQFLIRTMEPRLDGALEVAIPYPNDMFAK
ncbi:hypothetical protein WR25_26165 [Diploscapter pachys]|uniref:VWFA domain-containing protein n=1 Tax=Diploscapter pachys TaxID=2018661 RepID=A0A2A2J5U2_9BILA|nr:hypothetical protein WR25_26165 [Diploscapter pachys]